MLGVMLPPSGVMKAIDLQVCDLKLQKLVKPFARLHDHSKTLVSTYSDSCMGNTVAGFAMAVRFLTVKGKRVVELKYGSVLAILQETTGANCPHNITASNISQTC
ncbi:uncharacterized protein [Henckelia pumila]|uniref:uncharacterized protein isoform X3 n=1 Tax=Henckelia pumila TaxID=405737 RepID=UPI003C6E2492